MHEHVLKRINEIIEQGVILARSYGRDDYWVKGIIPAQAWISSAANAIQQVAPASSFFREELNRLMANDQLKGGIPTASMEKVLGLLQSVLNESNSGMLTKLEYQVVSSAFDDFLDHAEEYHRSGKIKEAATLNSAVLEDTLKRVAVKNSINPDGMSLDPLIDALTKADVFTDVKAKRLKAHAAVRNHALHAEWEKLELRDVGMQIRGVRELLDEHLQK